MYCVIYGGRVVVGRWFWRLRTTGFPPLTLGFDFTQC